MAALTWFLFGPWFGEGWKNKKLRREREREREGKKEKVKRRREEKKGRLQDRAADGGRGFCPKGSVFALAVRPVLIPLEPRPASAFVLKCCSAEGDDLTI
jgi:hypothetical protein